MLFTDSFYMDIRKIHIAHECVLNRTSRCEYPWGRKQYGLVYALSGQAEFRFYTGERFRVAEGNLLFLTPCAAYSIIIEKEFKHYTVNFDIHEASSNLGCLDNPYCLLPKESTEQFEHEFKKLIGLRTTKKAGFEMKAIGCLYDLIALFYLDFCDQKNHATFERLLPAKEHIEQNFYMPIGLEQLASLSNMSVTNFRREWKKLYGETPIQYRDSVRLSYAKEYLNSGYYTVSEIAGKCGFDDASYFVRFFKRQTGVTPGAYKKQPVGK